MSFRGGVIIVICYLININDRKRAKEKSEIISMVIWAASPGSYSFTCLREPQVHSLQIIGGRELIKGNMGTYAVKLR